MSSKYNRIVDQVIRVGLQPPKTLTLSITNGCNLMCRHCWPDSHSDKIVPPVPVDILKNLIHEFACLGVENLIITGGEPLTHPCWAEITAFACSNAGIRTVCLQTNATLLTEASISLLESKAFENLSIQVSLDGATAQSHERVRGPESFNRTTRGLNLLAKSALRKRTDVAFTEFLHNFEEIPQLFEMMDDFHFRRVVTSTLVGVGRAADAEGLNPPNPSQYRDLLTKYHLDASFRARYESFGSIAAIEWYKGRSTQSPRGCVLFEKPYLGASGSMYPCVLFQADEFAIHGLHKRELEDALDEVIPLWAGLQKQSETRVFKIEECARCSGRLHCASGCMGRAYLTHRNILSVEDRCLMRKAIYDWQSRNQ